MNSYYLRAVSVWVSVCLVLSLFSGIATADADGPGNIGSAKPFAVTLEEVGVFEPEYPDSLIDGIADIQVHYVEGDRQFLVMDNAKQIYVYDENGRNQRLVINEQQLSGLIGTTEILYMTVYNDDLYLSTKSNFGYNWVHRVNISDGSLMVNDHHYQVEVTNPYTPTGFEIKEDNDAPIFLSPAKWGYTTDGSLIYIQSSESLTWDWFAGRHMYKPAVIEGYYYALVGDSIEPVIGSRGIYRYDSDGKILEEVSSPSSVGYYSNVSWSPDKNQAAAISLTQNTVLGTMTEWEPIPFLNSATTSVNGSPVVEVDNNGDLYYWANVTGKESITKVVYGDGGYISTGFTFGEMNDYSQTELVRTIENPSGGWLRVDPIQGYVASIGENGQFVSSNTSILQDGRYAGETADGRLLVASGNELQYWLNGSLQSSQEVASLSQLYAAVQTKDGSVLVAGELVADGSDVLLLMSSDGEVVNTIQLDEYSLDWSQVSMKLDETGTQAVLLDPQSYYLSIDTVGNVLAVSTNNVAFGNGKLVDADLLASGLVLVQMGDGKVWLTDPKANMKLSEVEGVQVEDVVVYRQDGTAALLGNGKVYSMSITIPDPSSRPEALIGVKGPDLVKKTIVVGNGYDEYIIDTDGVFPLMQYLPFNEPVEYMGIYYNPENFNDFIGTGMSTTNTSYGIAGTEQNPKLVVELYDAGIGTYQVIFDKSDNSILFQFVKVTNNSSHETIRQTINYQGIYYLVDYPSLSLDEGTAVRITEDQYGSASFAEVPMERITLMSTVDGPVLTGPTQGELFEETETINLSWEFTQPTPNVSPEILDKTRVYVTLDPNHWDKYYEVNGDVSTLTLPKLLPGVVYYYYVQKYNANGYVGNSPVESFVVTRFEKPSFSNLVAVPDKTSATVSFVMNDPDGLATDGAKLKLLTAADVTLSEPFYDADIETYSVSMTGLTPNTMYEVQAYAETEYGDYYSDTLQLTTLPLSSNKTVTLAMSGLDLNTAVYENGKYTVTVPYETISTTVSYVLADPLSSAILLVDGNAASWNQSVELELGDTEFEVTVTAEDESTEVVTYVIKREAARVAAAPTNVTATSGNRKAVVAFTPPTDFGSYSNPEQISYVVTSSPDGVIATGNESPITVQGLQNGSTYTFTVYAVTQAGDGAVSVASEAVSLKMLEIISFTSLQAVPDKTSATVSFVMNDPDTLATDGAKLKLLTAADASVSEAVYNADLGTYSVSITGLTPNTTYDVQAYAETEYDEYNSDTLQLTTLPLSPNKTVTLAMSGLDLNTAVYEDNKYKVVVPYETISTTVSYVLTDLLSSASLFVDGDAAAWNQSFELKLGDTEFRVIVTAEDETTEVVTYVINREAARVAAAPTNVTATSGNRKAVVAFTPPTDFGSYSNPEQISYVVTASPGGAMATGNASPITVEGLSNGKSYTFTVYAVTQAGDGAVSASSAAVKLKVPETTIDEGNTEGNNNTGGGSGSPIGGNPGGIVDETIGEDEQAPSTSEPIDETTSDTSTEGSTTVKLNETVQLRKLETDNPSEAIEHVDLDGHWSQTTMNWAVQQGLLSGYPDGQAHPNGSITRAEFAALLVRMFEFAPGSDGANFRDIDNHWGKQAVQTLVQAGIIHGYSDGSFRPNQRITREEMIVLIARIADFTSAKDVQITDLHEAAAYSQQAIANAYAAGLVSGKSDGRFAPKASASRAEAVTILYNLFKMLNK